MKFGESSLELRQEDLNPNSSLRQLYKCMMNSVIGKFSQKPDFPDTQYVSSAQDIEHLFKIGEEIVDFNTISEDICEVQTAPPLINRKNRKTNPVITAFVTSLSRIDMHQNILLLEKSLCCPLYTDTDSIIFSAPKGACLPFQLNAGLGFFKPEFKSSLNGFCCIGKKSYTVSTKDNTETKVCGLSFAGERTKFAVSFSDFEDFLKKKTATKKIPQTRTLKTAFPLSVTQVIRDVQLSSTLNFSRILKQDEKRMYTIPYGLNDVNSTK